MNPQNRRDPLGISGTIIDDKYRVGHAVGEGGFSVVYLAEHTIWKQPVAIKCFKILANAPEDQRQRLIASFMQEDSLMAQLSSRSAAIVQARDVGTFITPDGTWIPFMVMEWLDGKPLDVVMADEMRAGYPPRQIHEVLALMEPAAVALELVHKRSIAHRDVKPANIFILGDPRGTTTHIKVLDFGIAKVMADHAAAAAALAHTGKDITAFTPNYGAPEQFSRSHGATGPWTDVFAMALILVELLRGGRPALEGQDFMQLAFASRDPMRRPSPRNHGVAVTDAVERVFLQALAVNPGDRYGTMGQFWAALHNAVFPDVAWNPGTLGGRMSMMSSGDPLASSGPRTPAQTPPSPQTNPNAVSTQPAPGSAKASIVVGALTVAALGLGGLFGYRALFGKPAAQPSASASASATASAPLPVAKASASASAAPVAARRTTCPDGMALVPGGRFFMGSDDADMKLSQPVHKVTVDTFCIDITEVTAAAYKQCSDIGECRKPEPVPSYPKSEKQSEEDYEKNRTALAELCNFGKDGRDKHPINCVPWSYADAYCKWAKKRLPTEAEWEYAARGSDGRKFPWGDEVGDQRFMNACGTECTKWETAHGLKPSPRMYEADDGFPGTAPVGSFEKGKTKFGAYDFVGNVWEWTADWFETYKPDEVVNPKGAVAGDRKVIRGGGYNGGMPQWVNPAFRYFQVATASVPAIGFRCAASL
ncbi:MAG TPA: bifunctional serine/threonine-protein kinase/formylglycine-generating enzyme family protein [Minicystis sp.]|nr:bifunctional serine/threonine-protein kinase/formylglycine-generating enzyme family protein [Minicystis sp.]